MKPWYCAGARRKRRGERRENDVRSARRPAAPRPGRLCRAPFRGKRNALPAEAEGLSPGDSLTVTGAGGYVLSDVYEGGPLVVSAGPEDKVQLVLAGAVLSKGSGPAIEVCSADKVFVTAAVSSEADLTVNGGGKLTVRAGEGHAVFSRDDLVVTAKNLSVEAGDIGLNGRDSVRLSEENVCITAGSDGIHSNGSVRISGGTVYVNGEQVTELPCRSD